MIRHWILIGAGVVIIALAAGCSRNSAAIPERHPVTSSAQDDSVQGVNALMRASPSPGQSVVVEGVVAGIVPKQHLMTLIDKAEFDRCKVTTCAALYLPVRWRGKLPSVKDTVKVRGKVAEDNGKRIVLAKELHTLAGTSDKASHETP